MHIAQTLHASKELKPSTIKFKSNSYHFIVSLEDEKYAKGIFDDIVLRRCLQKKLSAQYHSVDTASQFVEVFKRIKSGTIENNWFPHIHLECHGNEDGISLNNGFKIPWGSLAQLTTDINDVTKNNLVVSMALCYGGHFNVTLINKLNAAKTSRAPALAIIGPEKVITYGQLQDGFSAFFDTFLTTRNLAEAVKDLNVKSNYQGRYIYYTCEQMYESLINLYTKESINRDFGTEANFRSRMSSIIKQYQQIYKTRITQKQIKLLRDKMLDKSTYLELMEDMRKTYYWIDKYPENNNRFRMPEITNWEESIKHLKTTRE